MLALFLTALLITGVSSVELGTRQVSAKGDSYCGPSVCVSATVNGTSTVEYVVSSTGRFKRVGWIGIGFGYSMLETPMVIAWANSDGSMTLSQREASMHIMPTVVDNPPRIATASPELSQLSGSQPKFAFSLPLGDYTGVQNHIFAISTTRPSSSAVNAHIEQHDDVGFFKLDLSKDLEPSMAPSSSQQPSSTKVAAPLPTPKKEVEHVPSTDMPYTSYQRLIIAHAIFASLGFLVLLPLGVLMARYMRTFTPLWFKVHWMTQIAIAGPVILIGVGLGVSAVDATEGLHLSDGHKKWGATLFALYLSQALLGVYIHANQTKNGQRPPRNYAHGILGMTIICLSFKQVWSGYHTEWRYSTGRGPLPTSMNVFFWAWLGLFAVCYVLGLGLLRRQFRQECQVAGFRGATKETLDADEDGSVRLETRAVNF